MHTSLKIHRRLTLLFLAACTLAASHGRAQTVTSTFDTNADGWTHAPGGDPGSTVTFSATGGNPGGRIVLNEAAQGAFDFFQAPAKYLGNDSAFLNGTFSFQLMDNSSIDDLSAPLTLTDASGDTLTHVLPTFSPGSYVSFSFTLNQSGGWTYTPAGGTGSAATQPQFQTVLANVSTLVVPGDFHNGTELTSLDNVALTVPEPSTWALLLGAFGVRTLMIRRRFRFGAGETSSVPN